MRPAARASGRKPKRINSVKTSRGRRVRRLTQRTVGEGIVEELGEMFGQRAGGVHDMENQSRERLG